MDKDIYETGKTLYPLTTRPVTATATPAAGGGLYSRRQFVQAGFAGLVIASSRVSQAATPPSWSIPGAGFSNYGQPRASRDSPIRWISQDPSVPGDGVSWTPLHAMEGTITPNGLHFERHHNGVPTIDPATWELKIFGKVKHPLAFSLDKLHRYPLSSKIAFIECGGNSNSLWHPTPVQSPAGYAHGLVSCSEWTGVALSWLFEEANINPEANWVVVQGLDAAGVTVSIPTQKLLQDSMLALYQNGEPVRPENGFPARLLVPGWEGIVNLKWVASLQLTSRPAMSRFDTVSYTDLYKDGRSERFSFVMGVKSLITSPSPGQTLSGPGFYEIRGLAWTGNGVISRVEVSADGGRSWAEANLQAPVLDKALTRFRLPWNWDGSALLLKSRAFDESGQVQPERNVLIARKGVNAYYHYNAIITWSVDTSGDIRHVYA